MFVITRDVSAAKRVIATLLAIAVSMWALGLSNIAEAANLTEVEDLISDSAPLSDSNHTITFLLASSLATSSTIIINFDAANGFDFTGVTTGDFAITAGTATFSEAVNTGTDTITFTRTGGGLPTTGTLVTVTINGSNKINNPNPADGNESYEIDISAGTDSGHTRVVVLDTVLVTAQVLTTFDFTVTGLASGVAVNGTTTNITTSSTSIPFGVLTAYVPKTGAQDLQVRTNAANGFAVTVEADGALRSSTGADIDGFVDNSYVAVPTAWQSPLTGLSVLNENTWGHWGITTEDNDTGISGDDGLFPGDEMLANEFIGVTTTPRVIYAHDGPADNTTPDVGSTTIAYQVEISPLQEAGDDYQTTLTYIATPTF